MTPISPRAAFGSLVIAFLMSGCAIDAPVDPSPSDSSTQLPSPTAAATPAAQPVTVVRSVLGADVRVTVQPIQVQDGVAAVAVDYVMVTPPASETIGLGALLRSDWSYGSANRLRLVDLERRLVYHVLPAGTGWAGDLSGGADALVAGDLGVNAPVRSVTLHAAPKAATVSLLIPSMGLVDGIPVVPAGAEWDEWTADVDPPDRNAVAAYAIPLRTYEEAFAEGVVEVEQAGKTTVSLTADVLFAVDQDTLSESAQAALDAAAERIAALAPSGELLVVGHTDDTGTDEYNQDLSERRARTVAVLLGERLGHDYSITWEGRGEREPVAPGTSDEARAANRRGDITFETQTPEAATTAEAPQPALPEPTNAFGKTYPVASGTGVWLDYTTSSAGDPFRVRVDHVIRTRGVLVGYLQLSRSNDPDAGLESTFTGALSPSWDAAYARHGLDAADTFIITSAFGVTLLTDTGRLYGFDYQQPETSEDVYISFSTHLLGDENLRSNPDEATITTLVTVIWPDTGQDTVTIDDAERFRFTDIPVETDETLLNSW